ncbi:MAG: flagellar biosynthetic protein FliR [Porphyrobacter sp.]|jgi:flagellar biosynthetic protein FliR|nr:flagellar biosynthetic protein FliR [Porphyrobacter sp.]
MNTPDFGFAGLEAQLWQFLFLSIRCGAALMAAPVVSGMAVPVPVRVLLSLVLGTFIAIWLPLPPLPPMLSFAALLAVVQEVLIGAAMGFILQVAFAAALIAAEQIAGTMGLAIATSIDPSSGTQSGALGSYFSITMTLLFYAIGGHLLWFGLLVESHRLLPAGSFIFAADNAQAVVLFMGHALTAAAAIALPVVLVLLLVQVVTGVLARSAPQLNLFALGLPAGVLAGIAALIIVMPLVLDQFARVITAALSEIAGLAN